MPTQVASYSRIRFHKRQDLPDFTFVMWATVVLIGLTIASVAFGVAAGVDPAIFAAF